MNLIVVSSLSCDEGLYFRYITMIAKEELDLEILLEAQKQDVDYYFNLLKKHGKSKHPALISKLANKAYKDGVGDLVFTRLYDNNIKLVNQLNRLLTTDQLAREMSGFTRANLSTNLEVQKIKAQNSGDWKTVE